MKKRIGETIITGVLLCCLSFSAVMDTKATTHAAAMERSAEIIEKTDEIHDEIARIRKEEAEEKARLEAEEKARAEAEAEAARIEQENAAAMEVAQVTYEEPSSYTYYENGSGLNPSSGVNYYNGWRETYYSSNVLYHYRTPEWTVDANGVYRDADGYVIVASSSDPQGAVVDTSFGEGKVYDTGCAEGTHDIYTNW